MTTSITLTQAQAKLAEYLDAETKVLKGQRVQFGDRVLAFADLPEIRAGRQEWQQKVDALLAAAQGGASRYRFAEWNNT